MSELAFATDDRRRVSGMGSARFSLWGSVLVRRVNGWTWVRPSGSVTLGRWERPQLRRFWTTAGLVQRTVVAAGPVRLVLDCLVDLETRQAYNGRPPQ